MNKRDKIYTVEETNLGVVVNLNYESSRESYGFYTIHLPKGEKLHGRVNKVPMTEQLRAIDFDSLG